MTERERERDTHTHLVEEAVDGGGNGIEVNLLSPRLAAQHLKAFKRFGIAAAAGGARDSRVRA
jgi:hypothetical protein